MEMITIDLHIINSQD